MFALGNFKSGQSKVKPWIVIVLANVGLSHSMATRTFRLKVSDSISIQSASSQGMRQHLDRDAVKWVPPVRTLVTLDAPTFYPRIAPAGPPLPSPFLEEASLRTITINDAPPLAAVNQLA